MEKYEKIGRIGEGSYAQVYKCRNKLNNEFVAVKRFRDSDDSPLIRKISRREIKMLQLLRHPHLVNLLEVVRRKKRLHLVFEFCDMSLLTAFEEYPHGYPHECSLRVIYQLLQALKFCHAHKVIHRDVKPENILINNDGIIKLCDFGFARTIEPDDNLTEYVATRWYRAPELLVGDTKYDSSVDVWAVGCVLAELINGEPIWPGKSDLDMLHLITRSLGHLHPKHAELFEKSDFYKGKKGQQDHKQKRPLRKMMPSNFSNQGQDFLGICFDLDPDKRLDCEQLLSHPFFKGFHFSLPEIHAKKFEEVVKLSNKVDLPHIYTENSEASGSVYSQSDLSGHHRKRRYDTLPNVKRDGLSIFK